MFCTVTCDVPVWGTYVSRPCEDEEQGSDSQGKYTVHTSQVRIGINISSTYYERRREEWGKDVDRGLA